ncbi:MAG: hypothetical protein AB7N61_17325 [Acidimicrobiia bacterium]
MSTTLTLEPQAVERGIRAKLEVVELICEAELSDDELQVAESLCRKHFTFGTADRLANAYPATLCAYVAIMGAARYDPPALWPQLGVEGNSSPVGQAFLKALRSLGLDDFQDMVRRENARVYLAPILIHGGIPSSAAHRIVERVDEDLRRGLIDGADEVRRIQRDPDAISKLTRPVVRLFKYVPEFGADLIESVIDILTGEDTAASGRRLPHHLQEALRGAESRKQRGLTRLKLPFVQIEPWLPTGPEIVVPPGAGSWTVTLGNSTYVVGERLTAALHNAPRATASSGGRLVRLWSDPTVLWFTENGRLVNPGAPLPTYPIVLIEHGWHIHVNGHQPEIIEEGPALGGTWQRHRLVTLDLSPGGSIEIVDPDGSATKITTPIRPAAPALNGVVVPWVSGPGGRPVFRTAPELTINTGAPTPMVWFRPIGHATIAKRLRRGAHGRIDLAGIVGDDAVAGDVEVRDAAGKRITLPLAVVPGIRLDGLPEFMLADESCAVRLTTRVTTADITIPALVETLTVSSVAPFDLELEVPRVTWTLRSQAPTRVAPSSSVIHITAKDLARDGTYLVIRGAGANLSALVLEADGKTLQRVALSSRLTSGDNSAVSLAPFSDTLTHHSSERLSLLVEIGSAVLRVADTGQGSAGTLPVPSHVALPEDRVKALAQRFSGLDEASRVVEYLALLGELSQRRATRGVDAVITAGLAGINGLEELANSQWQTRGIRYRDYSGKLEQNILKWHKRVHQRVRKMHQSDRNSLVLWTLGRWFPGQDDLDGWTFRNVWTAVLGGRTDPKLEDRYPCLLLYEALHICGGGADEAGVFASALDFGRADLIELIAVLTEAARTNEVRLSAPPVFVSPDEPELDDSWAGPDLESSETIRPTGRAAFADPSTVQVAVEGHRLIVHTADAAASAIVRLWTDDRHAGAALIAPIVNGRGELEIPPGMHGTFLVEPVGSPLPLAPGGALASLNIAPDAQQRRSHSHVVTSLSDLSSASVDVLLNDCLTNARSGRYDPRLVSELFEDETAAFTALARLANAKKTASEDLDALAISLLPTATIFGGLAIHDGGARARLIRSSGLLGMLVLPRAASQWRDVGFPNPHRFDSGTRSFNDIVALAKVKITDLRAPLVPSYDLPVLRDHRVAGTLSTIQSNGATEAFVYALTTTLAAIRVEQVSDEAVRTLLWLHRGWAVVPASAVLCGFALHLALEERGPSR